MNPNPRKLDHVALYVGDPETVAAQLLSHLPFRIIEETDEFVLVGRDPMLGKLTLFQADPARERGRLLRVGIGIPCGTAARTIDLEDGLELELVPADPNGEVELQHLALVTPDPAASARAWLEFGFEPAPKGPNGVPRVRVGDEHIELHAGTVEETERPLLNHIGLLVDSLDDVHRSVGDLGLDVVREVDAESSRALFIRGPDDVEVEYIEHKRSLAFV